RTIDRDAGLHQPLASLVNVVHLVGEAAEVAAAIISPLVPVPGQLDLSALIARNAKEDKREAARLVLHPAALLQPQQLKECNSRLGIGDADHAVKEFHFILLNSSL